MKPTRSTPAALRREIAALLAAAGVPEPEAKAAEVVRRYREAGRHYHGLGHLRDLFRLFERYGEAVRDPEAFRMALVYHDAVYDPRAADNEERSAELAMVHLGDAPPGRLDRERVRDLILATRTHEPPAGADEDFALLLDMDLAVLGAAPVAYRRYAEGIRREYSHLPEAEYREGRARVLERFLARPRLYRTAAFFAAYEERARRNLSGEVEDLVGGGGR